MPKLTEVIMRSSQISRIFVSASMICIIGLLAYNWAVSPQTSYLHAARRYETVSMDMEKKAKMMGNEFRIKEIKLDKLKTAIGSSANSFFSPKQADQFFSKLEKIVNSAGCDLEALFFKKESAISYQKNDQKALDIYEKNAVLQLTGTYGQMVKLTSLIKAYPHKVYINELKIEPANSSTDNLSCSMNLKVYLTPDKELLIDE